MPLLVYCLTEDMPAVPPPKEGVQGRKIERSLVAGMACYYSVFPQAPKLTKQDALVFHKIIRSIFALTGVIPFRFPTVLEGKGELDVYLETEGHDLLDALQRLRDDVQMEVRLTCRAETGSSAESGTEYLKDRRNALAILQEVADSARDELGEVVQGWHTRDFPNGLRCYALINRADVANFRKKCEAVESKGEVLVAVSGPWPPTEFLHDTSEP